MTSQPLSENDFGLGEKKADYVFNRTKEAITCVRGIAQTLVGFALAAWMILYPTPEKLPFIGPWLNGAPLWIFAAVPAIIGLAGCQICREFFLQRTRRVVIFQDGFCATSQGRTECIRWDDIRGIAQRITEYSVNYMPSGTTHKYRVLTGDGVTHHFDDLWPGVEALNEALHEETTCRLLPGMTEMFNAGEKVGFGPVAISIEGIHSAKDSLPWSELEDLKIVNGLLHFKKLGKKRSWATVAIGDVWNPRILLYMIDQIRKG